MRAGGRASLRRDRGGSTAARLAYAADGGITALPPSSLDVPSNRRSPANSRARLPMARVGAQSVPRHTLERGGTLIVLLQSASGTIRRPGPTHQMIFILATFYFAALVFIAKGSGRLMRLATFFALFGAFPGFVIEMVHSTAATPAVYGPTSLHWRDFLMLPIPYFFFGVPLLLGPYCFAAGLAGGFAIRLTQESPHRWLEPLAIIILPMIAAIPMALLWRPLDAFGSSMFWVFFLMTFRKRIFGEAALEPSPLIRSIYLWATVRK